MKLFEGLEAIRDRWNVLRHPFYERWSRGELERQELAFYAGEYRHAVVALAEAVDAAARAAEPAVRAELEAHAAEEAAHVELWDGFAEALGADRGRQPLLETTACAESWTGAGGFLEGLVTLYAIEAGQPAVAATKLAGLVDRYDVEEGPATAYFSLHAERDHEHAAQSRRLIEDRLDAADVPRLLERAEAALEGNWRLLDGVEKQLRG